jgi:hypothetical protein
MLVAKIERFRSRGLDIHCAVDLAADQHRVDPNELAIEHFAWLFERYGSSRSPTNWPRRCRRAKEPSARDHGGDAAR